MGEDLEAEEALLGAPTPHPLNYIAVCKEIISQCLVLLMVIQPAPLISPLPLNL